MECFRKQKYYDENVPHIPDISHSTPMCERPSFGPRWPSSAYLPIGTQPESKSDKGTLSVGFILRSVIFFLPRCVQIFRRNFLTHPQSTEPSRPTNAYGRKRVHENGHHCDTIFSSPSNPHFVPEGAAVYFLGKCFSTRIPPASEAATLSAPK